MNRATDAGASAASVQEAVPAAAADGSPASAAALGPRVLIVDDEAGVRQLLTAFLRKTLSRCEVAARATEALALAAAAAGPSGGDPFELAITDIRMPGMDGLELLGRLHDQHPDIEVIDITAYREIDLAIEALRRGASDFLTKPLNLQELAVCCDRALRQRTLTLENRRYKNFLEDEIAKRTRDIERITLGLVAALEHTSSLNDTDTGNHIRRVSGYSELIARRLGLDPELCRKIERFASLHDVGKVGIPHEILKKPGKLTPEEFEAMKAHTRIGYSILETAGADPVALNIVLYHHEKYGGGGYPTGITGERIPIEARIVALADAFDAMTTRRCYKEPISHEEAETIVRAEAGRHFDPEVVAAFLVSRPEVLEVKHRFRAEEARLGATDRSAAAAPGTTAPPHPDPLAPARAARAAAGSAGCGLQMQAPGLPGGEGVPAGPNGSSGPRG